MQRHIHWKSSQHPLEVLATSIGSPRCVRTYLSPCPYLPSTTSGTSSYALLHRLLHPASSPPTPCFIASCTLLHRLLHPASSPPAPCCLALFPLEFRLPRFLLGCRSRPDLHPSSSCMQIRISKTLLTLLILLKNLSCPALVFFTEINFFSKVSKVFEILFCKHTPFLPLRPSFRHHQNGKRTGTKTPQHPPRPLPLLNFASFSSSERTFLLFSLPVHENLPTFAARKSDEECLKRKFSNTNS